MGNLRYNIQPHNVRKLFPSDVPVHRLGREKFGHWQDDNAITSYSEIFALVHFGDFSLQHDKLCILGISKENS